VVEPAVKLVIPVLGLTVTTRSAKVVPHRPVAVALTVAVPLKEADQFITPVEELIVPAPAGDTL
jgi:hypothetical protein